MALAGDVLRMVGNVLYYCGEYLYLWAFPQRKDVKGEIVLVTGAGSGIGRLLALKLARLGAVLVLWDINEQQAEGVAKEISDEGGKAHVYKVDVSRPDSVHAAATQVAKDVGKVDILVNNAGVVSGKPLLECDDASIARTMAVNCTAHLWTVKAFLPKMLEADHGQIVTVASAAGLVGTPGLVDYCASKFGAVGFDESLRNELVRLGKTGVKTLCVCPYFTNTGMFEGASTRFSWLMPILDQEYVASKMADSILRDDPMLIMPRFLHSVFPLRALLPTKAIDECNQFLGALETMDSFKGRQ